MTPDNSNPKSPSERLNMDAFQLKGFLRLPQVLALIPISRSAWWAGCKSGRYPKPIKLGSRTTVWRAADILALVERLSQNEGKVTQTGHHQAVENSRFLHSQKGGDMTTTVVMPPPAFFALALPNRPGLAAALFKVLYAHSLGVSVKLLSPD